jgi:hypothetical protein
MCWQDGVVSVRLDVNNARASRPIPDLPTHGFKLVQQHTALSMQDFYDSDAKIKNVYYSEMATAISKVLCLKS